MAGVMVLVSRDGQPISEAARRSAPGASACTPAAALDEGVVLSVSDPTRDPRSAPADGMVATRNDHYTIAWDGRLDNRAELAQALAFDPAEARRRPDSEYVLAAFERWGDHCVHHLLGDWAFALWDARDRRLFCAKDPLGWRQMFYTTAGDTLTIAPEAQQLFATGLVRREVNEAYLLRFLADAVQEPGQTCYKGIQELQGGQTLTLSGAALRIATYWEAPHVTPRPYRRPEEYVEEFVHLFRAAVRARLRDTGRIGVFLSGGLDSSYIAAIAAEEGATITALTGYAPGTQWMDERNYAGLVVRHLGIEQREVDLSDCWSLSHHWLPDHVFDEPELAPQAAAHVKLAAAAREAGVKVILSGEGADEWMTAESGYVADAVLRGRIQTAWRILPRRRRRYSRSVALAKACYNGFIPARTRDMLSLLRHGSTGAGFPAWVRPDPTLISAAAYGRTLAWQRERARQIAWRTYRQTAARVVSWRERNASGPNGIQARTPFNDLRIVELMAATPEWMKQFAGRRKDLLRAAERRVLPAAIPDRDDFGLYTELVERGIGSAERERAMAALESISAVPGINSSIACQEARNWIETQHRWWEPNWRLITAGLWLRQMGIPCSAPLGGARQPKILTERR